MASHSNLEFSSKEEEFAMQLNIAEIHTFSSSYTTSGLPMGLQLQTTCTTDYRILRANESHMYQGCLPRNSWIFDSAWVSDKELATEGHLMEDALECALCGHIFAMRTACAPPPPPPPPPPPLPSVYRPGLACGIYNLHNVLHVQLNLASLFLRSFCT